MVLVVFDEPPLPLPLQKIKKKRVSGTKLDKLGTLAHRAKASPYVPIGFEASKNVVVDGHI